MTNETEKLPSTPEEALAVFHAQLSDRIGADLAMSLTPRADYVALGARFVVSVMTRPGGYGRAVTEEGPRPEMVLTNYPLPVDKIVGRLVAIGTVRGKA